MTSDNASTKHLLSRLVRGYVSAHKGRVSLAVVCMVIVAVMTALNAWLMQPVLDDIFFNKDESLLFILPAAIVVIAVVGGLANYFQTVLMRHVGQRIVADLQIELFAHLVHGDLGVFHEQASGRLISRFTNDIQLMRNAVSTVLTGLAKELLSLVFLIGVMLWQSWQLAAIAFLLYPVAIYPVMRLGKRMRKIADGTQVQLGEFTAQLDETFSSAREVKAYVREDYEVGRARKTVDTLFGYYLKASRVQAAASPMMEAVGAIGIAAVIAYGGWQVIHGDTTAGMFFSFMAAMLMAYKPLRAIAGLNTNLQEGLAAAHRLFTVLDTPPTVQDAPDAKALEVGKGDIAFEKVAFSYHADAPALHDLSLKIKPGSMVALVGPSGSGKSTFMNLLMRFYDVNGGRILIDGQDIAGVTQASLRANMALVSQDVMLFDDSVAANIVYGREGASQVDIEKVAKAAAADEFIKRLPMGYDTRIGPQGVTLSGGQRQRLSIARAMLKDAPILLLDEATSALDTQSEKAVQKALDELMQGRTTLVIAHRLSTVQHADVICVLDDGRLVEQGTHEELLAKDGLYHKLCNAQMLEGG